MFLPEKEKKKSYIKYSILSFQRNDPFSLKLVLFDINHNNTFDNLMKTQTQSSTWFYIHIYIMLCGIILHIFTE